MKFLHTSDWHLGQLFFFQKREQEHKQFLDWLLTTIEAEQIDLLLVAGDIFDTGTPGNYALKLYYDFLRKVSETCCCHVVITGGNHDSAATLNAPKALLRAFNVHVRGNASSNPHDEVIALKDNDGELEAIICAVPYLREGDVRHAVAGESYQEKSQALQQGIIKRYRTVTDEGIKLKGDGAVPIIGMGHLFTAGGMASETEREVYIGTLGHVPGGSFPEELDYLALGHLHVPQLVGGSETRQYCGSPLPMSFGEAKQQKLVLIGDFDEGKLNLSKLPIPVFQPLLTIEGDLKEIESAIASIPTDSKKPYWCEIRFTGKEIIPDLKVAIEELVGEAPIKIFVVKDLNRENRRLALATEQHETLNELSETEVFTKCLKQYEIDESEHEEMLGAFQELLAEFNQGDSQ